MSSRKSKGIILAAGFILLLFVGIVYAWSILSVPLSEEYHWNSRQLSLNFTVMMSFFCLSGIVSGKFCTKTGRTAYSLAIAGVLICIGFIGTAYCTNGHIVRLYLFYGICIGTGAGFAYNSIVSAVTAWYSASGRGKVTGVLMMGFSISTLVMGSVIDSIISRGTFRWQSVFAAYGVITCAILLCGIWIIRFPYKSNSVETVKADGKKPSEMLRTPSFYIVFLYAVAGSVVGCGVIAQAKQIALNSGTDYSTATFCVGTLAVSNGLGRIVSGAVYDKRGQKAAMLLPVGILALGLAMLLIALQYEFPYLAMVGLTLIGFTYGCMPSICATFVADKFGSMYYAANLSLINLTMLLSSFSSVISGTLYAKSGSFLSVLILYSISWGIMLTLYVVGKNMYKQRLS